ncbi:hypothetical protein [Ferruginibacter profundus]
MRKSIKTFLTFIGVWFIASLLNGLLSGICISVIDQGTFFQAPGIMILSCVMSFLFSVPLVGLVWIVTVIAQATGKSGHSLFQVVLAAAFICGMIGALFFINSLGNEFKTARFVAAFCIIVSAMCGVLVFRNQLKTEE